MKELCKEADVSDPEVYAGALPTGALQHAVITRNVSAPDQHVYQQPIRTRYGPPSFFHLPFFFFYAIDSRAKEKTNKKDAQKLRNVV